MEVGNLLKQMIYLAVTVVAIVIFISIAWNYSGQDCKLTVGGNNLIILGNLKICAERCWSKHEFGNDLYMDDCFVLNVTIKDELDRNRIESSLNKSIPIRTYFGSLEGNKTYSIKIRYNSTGKEISLVKVGEFG